MNKKVKELAEFHYLNINVMQAIYDDITLFIVEECINSLGSQTDQSNLRKKFGIAEPTVEGIGRYYPPPDINSAESQYDRRARIENSSKQEDFKKNIKQAFKDGADLSNQDTP